LKKEGGNLLRGVPPTKKAPAAVKRRSLHGSCNRFRIIIVLKRSLVRYYIKPVKNVKIFFLHTIKIIFERFGEAGG
jgi:hypothetical protein